MTSVSELSDNDLRVELIERGFAAGPVTGTTRRLYEKKLETLRRNGESPTEKVNGKAQAQVQAVAQTPKSTPLKNGAPPPAYTGTPVSAKRRGRKPQVLAAESSDNELDLTVSSSVFNDSSAPASASRRTANETPSATIVNQTPPRPAGVAQRTPTPPRASRTPRTPLRNDPVAVQDFSTSFRGNIFSSPAAKSPSAKSTRSTTTATAAPSSELDSFGGLSASSADDEDLDDHLESSRIIPRFESRYSLGSRSSSVKRNSPIDKLRRFAGGYFSRSSVAATPCGSVRRGGYSAAAATQRQPPGSESCDVSGWIVIICVTFLASIISAYVWSASPETIQTIADRVTITAKATWNFFYTYLILPVGVTFIVLLFGGAAFQFNKWREARAKARQECLMGLVERITEIISEHGRDGVPELHVRDIIMPPTKRTSDDWALWTDAAAFINVEDSRVRTEIRLVNGDECNVWIWVSTTAHKWQGAAVDDRTLHQNIPPKALTRCIKLRGVEIPTREPELCTLRTELLRRLSPVVPVHMDFARAPESVVYLMLKNLEDAKRAFLAFHSQWFQGEMISAKYLRDERYVERFPDAVRCL